mgnify:CR=1 FL=1
MAPQNRRLVFLNQVLDTLRKQLPDASDADLLKAATRQSELEETSRAVTSERKAATVQQKAADAKEAAEKQRIENPRNLYERIVGPEGSPRRQRARGVAEGALTTAIPGGILLGMDVLRDRAIDQQTPVIPQSADSGKTKIQESPLDEIQYLQQVQKLNQEIKGQNARIELRRKLGSNEEFIPLLQGGDPVQALEDSRASKMKAFTRSSEQKIQEKQEESAGRAREQAIIQQGENDRKVLELVTEVMKGQLGSLDQLPGADQLLTPRSY